MIAVLMQYQGGYLPIAAHNKRHFRAKLTGEEFVGLCLEYLELGLIRSLGKETISSMGDSN